MSKILLLEDDLLFGETLVDLLEEENFEVFHVKNGQDAIDITYENNFDLYLLDINVPLINGIFVLKDLRAAEDKTPAIFLTSYQDKEMLREGFLSGGDDYLRKPFDNDELLFRINAILNRTKIKINKCIGLLCHDEIHKQILYDEKVLDLSIKEYQLLLLLMQYSDKPVSKELILDTLWSKSDGGSEGALRVYINRVKQVLPKLSIENVRGFGYKLVS